MCEKAARIAELEREIEAFEAVDGLSILSEQAQANITHTLPRLRAELARLSNEQLKRRVRPPTEHEMALVRMYDSPALPQGEGSEPVGWRYRYKNERGAVWGYTDSESVAASYEAPVYEVEPLYASPPPLPAANADPVQWDLAALHDLAVEKYKIAREVYSSDHDTALLTVVDELLYKLRGSDFPSSSGNADPRVREALEEARSYFQNCATRLAEDAARYDAEDRLTLARSTEDSSKRNAAKAELLSQVLALPSPQSQGLVDAAEWTAIGDLFDIAKGLVLFGYDSGEQQHYRSRFYEWKGKHKQIVEALRSRASDRSA